MRVGNGAVALARRFDCPVHPHACGERINTYQTLPQLDGSSPCVWGTAVLPLANNQNQRFIPMRVGNG